MLQLLRTLPSHPVAPGTPLPSLDISTSSLANHITYRLVPDVLPDVHNLYPECMPNAHEVLPHGKQSNNCVATFIARIGCLQLGSLPDK